MKKKFKAFVEELRKNGATRYDISTMKKEKRKVLHRNVITWLIHIFKVKQPKIIYIIKKKIDTFKATKKENFEHSKYSEVLFYTLRG